MMGRLAIKLSLGSMNSLHDSETNDRKSPCRTCWPGNEAKAYRSTILKLLRANIMSGNPVTGRGMWQCQKGLKRDSENVTA